MERNEHAFTIKRKFRFLLGILGAICVLGVLGIGIYLNDYYRAEEIAFYCIENPAEGITVTERDNLLIFAPKEPVQGIIFYPGGKVEAESYAPLMESLARQGTLCILIKMPGNLAVLDSDAAKGLQADFPEIQSWYMAGHSLGGSMAASYIGSTEEKFEGLILLAAYSTADLSETDIEVLSVYGENDGVLNMENYQENKAKLPSDYTEVIIDGGCHAYFGAYGKQEGDGMPEITMEEQIRITTEVIEKFMQSIG